jgi:PAS domain-containing protein
MSERRKERLEHALESLGKPAGLQGSTFFPLLLGIIPCPIAITDSDGRFLAANPRAQTLLRLLADHKTQGFRLPTVAWLKADESALPAPELPWLLSATLGEVVTEELAALFPREDPLWLRVTSSPLPGGLAISHVESINEARRAQLELQHQFEQMDTFFDTTLDMLSLSNPEGRLIRINPVWERTLGYSLADLHHPSRGSGDQRRGLGRPALAPG